MRLSVNGLAVGFEGVPIQHEIDFVIEPGARVGLSGPSGSGKSTTLRALAMLDAPLEGEVTLGGQRPAQIGYPSWRRRVLYVSQRASFFGGTVLEELERPFGFATAAQPFDRGRALEALETLGLSTKQDAPSGELSEGERQRVSLVRAVLLDPDVLLLDEPTSALDSAAAKRAEAWLDAGRASVLLVT
ncbi:MAG TPA: ATP-binding cassette domain-containing protein, partial [Polyangiaceae bacterium]|nr:ATP-binding cassette domain-containing protein [Polyangiaceae bacterium]